MSPLGRPPAVGSDGPNLGLPGWCVGALCGESAAGSGGIVRVGWTAAGGATIGGRLEGVNLGASRGRFCWVKTGGPSRSGSMSAGGRPGWMAGSLTVGGTGREIGSAAGGSGWEPDDGDDGVDIGAALDDKGCEAGGAAGDNC